MKESLTLGGAVELARQTELVKTQNAHASAQSQSAPNLDTVSRGRGNHRRGFHKASGQHKWGQPSTRGGCPQRGCGQRQGDSHLSSQPAITGSSSCGNCGLQHDSSKPNCPARGVTCHKCNKIGHFDGKCCGNRAVQEVSVTPVAEPDDVERLLLGSMSSVSNNDSHIFADDAWYKTLTLDGGAVKFKLDTGADVSIVIEETWRQLNPGPHLKAVQTKLMTPSGPLLPSGQFVSRSGSTHFRVIVASTAAENLLDRTTTVRMDFIKRVAEITFADLFC